MTSPEFPDEVGSIRRVPEEDYAPCSSCREPVKSTGFNFEHVHVDPWDWRYPSECRPTYASPNHLQPRIPRKPVSER